VSKSYKVLILGASYGSLLGAKLALAGHSVTLVCLPSEVELINAEGAIVRMPVKGREGLVEVNTRTLPGSLTAAGPTDVNPADFDLVALAMQEPQYRTPGARELTGKVAQSRVPCMSIMNMPPLPFLKRIATIDATAIRQCFADASVWDGFEPGLMTLCSPDPQAFRPPEEKVNVLQVRLPTNFKAARFENPAHTQILKDLERDIEAARFNTGTEKLELPVKLKAHDSLFVPLAKWCMLLAGNYRCIERNSVRTIKEAVHSDLAASRAVYDYVFELCVKLGADAKDLVPFDKYAQAALSLGAPSSAARAIQAGAPNIERVDRLVKLLGAQHGMHLDVIDETVALVDTRLAENRKKAS
jgi:hypothetical protein